MLLSLESRSISVSKSFFIFNKLALYYQIDNLKCTMRKITILLLFFTATIYSQCNIDISAGARHTVLLKTDGKIQTWGNGINGLGALGFGNNLNVTIPTDATLVRNVKKIFSGAASTFVILQNNTLWATGNNNRGQLGNGTHGTGNMSNSFEQIGTASDWESISADNVQTLGIKIDGTLWGWGSNSQGKLGNGTWLDSDIPIKIGTDSNWKEVSTNLHYTTALKTDGTLWGWGLLDAVGNSTIPVQIGTSNDWKTLSSDMGVHTLALKNDGRLYVFGGIWEINYGTLGLGPTVSNAQMPTQIGTDSDWEVISASARSSSAIKTNGTLWSWGQNSVGNLGDGTQIHRFVPTQISSDTDWEKVSVGLQHVAALKSNGDLYTWGDNMQAQLGNGNYNYSMVPLFINSCTLHTQDFQKRDAVVFPNPAKDYLTVQFNDFAIIDKIEVLDITGRLVQSKMNNENTEYMMLDVSSLKAGVYVIKLTDGFNNTVSKKIIKE